MGRKLNKSCRLSKRKKARKKERNSFLVPILCWKLGNCRVKGKEKQKRNRHCRRRRQTVRRMAAAPLASWLRLLLRREASLARFLPSLAGLHFAAAESVETAARFCLFYGHHERQSPKSFSHKLFLVKGRFSVTQRGFSPRTSLSLCFVFSGWACIYVGYLIHLFIYLSMYPMGD